MGEPLYNFDNVKRRHRGRHRRRRARLLQAPHHAVDLRRRARDRARGRGDRHDARDLAARGARRAARRAGADQPQIPDRRAAGRLPQLSGALQRAAHHLRIRDAEGRQRHHRRGQGAGPAARRNPCQDQPDPVQSLARLALRMLRLGADRALRGRRQPRGLCEPDPHPARARHHGGVRPAQIGEREAARERLAASRAGQAAQ